MPGTVVMGCSALPVPMLPTNATLKLSVPHFFPTQVANWQLKVPFPVKAYRLERCTGFLGRQQVLGWSALIRYVRDKGPKVDVLVCCAGTASNPVRPALLRVISGYVLPLD